MLWLKKEHPSGTAAEKDAGRTEEGAAARQPDRRDAAEKSEIQGRAKVKVHSGGKTPAGRNESPPRPELTPVIRDRVQGADCGCRPYSQED